MKRGALRFVFALTLALASSASNAQSYAGRDDVRAFIDYMVARHGFSRSELDTAFAKARYQASVVKAMTPAVSGARSWRLYRSRFVNPQRIDGGVAFWNEHAESLARAARTYGVPAEIIVAIIGVETEYGRQTGGYRVLDALATLAFDYPRRAEFFRTELEEFLLLAREANLNPLALKGSFAGAVGLPQFMPGSYRRFAVDFDGDGKRDLAGSAADAIGSVANFLQRHGWNAGAPIAFPATLTTQEARTLADGGVEPVRRAAELRQAAVSFDPSVADDAAVVLVELDSVDAASAWWVGLANFYVLTRYNRSSFYAVAVLELAQEIKAARSDP